MFKWIKKYWDWCWSIYRKNEEVWNYLITGAIGTVISIVSYSLCRQINLGIVTSNVISWIIAVASMYVLNKIFVFKTKCKNSKDLIREIVSFVTARLFTLIVETGILYAGVELLSINDIIIKVIAQIIVIILNYILSKLIIFKKDKNTK